MAPPGRKSPVSIIQLWVEVSAFCVTTCASHQPVLHDCLRHFCLGETNIFFQSKNKKWEHDGLCSTFFAAPLPPYEPMKTVRNYMIHGIATNGPLLRR